MDARVASRVDAGRGRTWYNIRLAGPEDVDEAVRGWLTEAYEAAGD
jgi:hypothetical protein